MAFWLGCARRKSYPASYAAEVRESHLRYLRIAFAVAALGTFVGLCAFFGTMLRVLAGVEWDMQLFAGMMLPWYALMFTMGAIGHGASVAAVAGHGRVGLKTVSGYHLKAPHTLRHVRSATLLWASALALAAAVATATLSWPRYTPFEAPLPGLSLHDASHVALLLAGAALAALLGRWAAAWTRQLAEGWREERRRRAREEDILARGGHAVGRVKRVRFTGECVDMKSLFLLEVAYEADGRGYSVAFPFPEYPRWAPVVGNAFDVWFDPAAPDAPQSTLLQRRLVGQEGPAAPERYRVQLQTDGDGKTDISPPWAGQDDGREDVVVGALFRCLGQLAAIVLWIASVPVWLRTWPAGPHWVVLLVLPHLLLAAACALGWWKRMRAPAAAPDAWCWARAAGYLNFALGLCIWPVLLARMRTQADPYFHSLATENFPVLWLALALGAWALVGASGMKLPAVSDEAWARRIRQRAVAPLADEEVYEALYLRGGAGTRRERDAAAPSAAGVSGSG